MLARDRVEYYAPSVEDNGSGGKTVTDPKGKMLLSTLAEATELKPTREQLAEQTELTKTLKVVQYARKGVELDSGTVMYWNDKPYSLQGPPVTNAMRTEWTIYAKQVSQ